MMGRPAKDTSVFGQFEYENPGIEYQRVPISDTSVCLRAEADFTDKKDLASFSIKIEKVGRSLALTSQCILRWICLLDVVLDCFIIRPRKLMDL